MQCPPSPLLFDPSADMALKDLSRTPLDILADDTERNNTSHSLLTESLVGSIGQVCSILYIKGYWYMEGKKMSSFPIQMSLLGKQTLP